MNSVTENELLFYSLGTQLSLRKMQGIDKVASVWEDLEENILCLFQF